MGSLSQRFASQAILPPREARRTVPHVVGSAAGSAPGRGSRVRLAFPRRVKRGFRPIEWSSPAVHSVVAWLHAGATAASAQTNRAQRPDGIPVAKTAARGIGPRRRFAAALACALAASTLAHAQRNADPAADRVALTIAYVEGCSWMDDLHRTTCAKIGPRLSEKNRPLCAMAERPLGERVAASYAAFRERNRTVIAASGPTIASTVEKTRASLERQFARMRAGQVSMLDLESLSRELGGRCNVVETDWLRP